VCLGHKGRNLSLSLLTSVICFMDELLLLTRSFTGKVPKSRDFPHWTRPA
jgi:hypothetical protein